MSLLRYLCLHLPSRDEPNPLMQSSTGIQLPWGYKGYVFFVFFFLIAQTITECENDRAMKSLLLPN